MPDSAPVAPPLHRTPLHALHCELGARMVPFAGYDMPVQYPAGIIAEHTHTRSAAGLFDVSHMGQAILTGPDFETAARFLERLVPGDILGLAEGRLRYTQLTNPSGGTRDDLMVTNLGGGRLGLVVNASRKADDFAVISAALPPGLHLAPQPHLALLALQGPASEAVLARHLPGVESLAFMAARGFGAIHVSRSGYTGEDGFEISLPAADAESFARRLLAEPEVKPVGLGARDSLRLEAGLCLYGHELDEEISPIEAGLLWSIGKRRRAEGGFPGDGRILAEIAEGPARRRVGIKPEGRAPVRDGAEIRSADGAAVIGRVTSGGFGPSVGGPIAIGFVSADHAKPGTRLTLMLRGNAVPAEVAALPFIPNTFKR